MTTLAIIGSGVLVGLIIAASAFHILLLPLSTTNQSNLQVFTKYGEQRVQPAIDGGYTPLFDPQWWRFRRGKGLSS